jgi:hypothetical protein
VLAREGGLVLLASISDPDFADSLLALLAVVADAGGDGRQLANAVEDALEHSATRSATTSQPGPAVVALGPYGTGLALTVCGAAWADIATSEGVQRLVSAQQGVRLRCVVNSPVTEVRGRLGSEPGDGGSTDRFSHLDRGAVHAGGLLYIPERSPGPGAQSAPPPAAADEVTPEPAAAPSSALPDPAGPAEPADAETIAGQIFESVLLVGESMAELQPQPALPLETGAPEAPAQASPRAVVTGVYCKNGHFDDPEARFCAVCGISMNQQTLVPRPGPRPPLGVLAFDDGAVFQLDSDYVIGREPALSPSVLRSGWMAGGSR